MTTDYLSTAANEIMLASPCYLSFFYFLKKFKYWVEPKIIQLVYLRIFEKF